MCSSVQELFKGLVVEIFFGEGLMMVMWGVDMGDVELLHDMPLRHTVFN